jgi:acrylyl-CoA reductase (NADPH)
MKAILINKDETSGYTCALSEVDEAQLPEGDVLVHIEYSTLNYKDGLAITGKAPVVRRFPMVAGIDFAGTVIESSNDRFKAGDQVILNGWGVGETHWGGLAEKARVKAEWLIKKPDGLTSAQTMAIGTAGYTAMLCVQAIQSAGITPDSGTVLVTGANGGVGSFALRILKQLGYTTCASTGRPEEADYLKALGASEIIDRAELSEPGKPLQAERWAAVVDSVGSHTLANACAQTQWGGAVAACGLAQGMDLKMTVAPFILRGVSLLGVDSVMQPIAQRESAWAALAEVINQEDLNTMTNEITLDQVIETGAALLEGKVRGRVAVKIQ